MSDSDDEFAPRGFGAKKRSSEAAMLGVFGDGSDSDEPGQSRKRRSQGGESAPPLAARPVSFVSKGAEGASKEDVRPPPPPPMPHAGRPSQSSAPPAAAKPPVEKVDKEFGAFENHGTGFGARMLQKMGWTKGGAIGRQGQGIVNPLESKLRPNSMGLGFGGFSETSAKAKLQQKRILHGGEGGEAGSDDSDSGDGAGSSRRRAARRQPQGEAKPQYWKKHEKRELNVRSAAELRAQWDTASAQQQWAGGTGVAGAAGSAASITPVVDMRGPQAKVHTSARSAPTPTVTPTGTLTLALALIALPGALERAERAERTARVGRGESDRRSVGGHLAGAQVQREDGGRLCRDRARPEAS